MPIYFPGTGGALYRVARASAGRDVSFDNIEVAESAREAAKAALAAARRLTLPKVSAAFGSVVNDGLKKAKAALSSVCVLRQNMDADGVLDGDSLFGAVFLGYVLLARQEAARVYNDPEWDPLIVVSAPGSAEQAELHPLKGLDSKLRTVTQFAESRNRPVLFLHSIDPEFVGGPKSDLVTLRPVTTHSDLIVALQEAYDGHSATFIQPRVGPGVSPPTPAGSLGSTRKRPGLGLVALLAVLGLALIGALSLRRGEAGSQAAVVPARGTQAPPRTEAATMGAVTQLPMTVPPTATVKVTANTRQVAPARSAAPTLRKRQPIEDPLFPPARTAVPAPTAAPTPSTSPMVSGPVPPPTSPPADASPSRRAHAGGKARTDEL